MNDFHRVPVPEREPDVILVTQRDTNVLFWFDIDSSPVRFNYKYCSKDWSEGVSCGAFASDGSVRFCHFKGTASEPIDKWLAWGTAEELDDPDDICAEQVLKAYHDLMNKVIDGLLLDSDPH